MEQKIEQFILKGMQRDTSISKVPNEFSFENMNIRITARDNNTLLSVTNEKGNKEIELLLEDVSLIPNKLSVEYNEDEAYRVVAEFPVASTVTGSAKFYDIDGEYSQIDYWKIETGNTTFDWRPMLQEIPQVYNLTVTNGNPYDDKYTYYPEGTPIIYPTSEIVGSIIGYAALNNYIILFNKIEENVDRIYRIAYNKDKNIWTSKVLFSGNLNLSEDNPIETLPIYENEDVQKVYWVDGKNQPRVINIVAPNDTLVKWNSSSFTFNPFDIVPTLKLQEKVSIERNLVSNGVFAPGVIQYVFTYFNKYGQESNPFYTSPLYYTSFNDRGGSPEDKVSNSFNITIKNVDSNFEYVRVYSLLRTSLDGTPLAKRVADIAPTESTIEVFDGLSGAKDPMYSFSSSTSSNNIKPSSFLLYSVIRDTEVPTISILDTNTEITETKYDGTIVQHYTINPYSNVILGDGKEIKNYTILKFPFLGTGGSTQYCKITKPTRLSLYMDRGDDSIVRSFELQPVYKGEKSFYLGYDIKYAKTYELNYIDTGTTGETIDPTELLYLGGEDITAETLTQKDNTLFLGNIKLNRTEISSEIRDSIFDNMLEFTYDDNKTLYLPDPEGHYQYENSLRFNSVQNKVFKYGEWYRFGLQFQHKTGKWSEPIWVNDVRNDKLPDGDALSSIKRFATVKKTLGNNIIEKITKHDYLKVRPVVVYPTFTDREVICQGLLCPTVYNMQDRLNNAPFVQSSWFIRPYCKDLVSTSLSSPAEFRHNQYLPDSLKRNAEIQNIYEPVSPYIDESENIEDYISDHSENFYVDQSIVTLHSPDIEFDDNIQNLDISRLSLRIVGAVPITSCYGDIDIQTSTPQGMYKMINVITPGFYHKAHSATMGKRSVHPLISGPFWMDTIINGTEKHDLLTGYVVYPWHRNGSLNNQRSPKDNYRYAMLQYKKLSNFKVSYNTKYTESISINTEDVGIPWEITDAKIFNSNEVTALKLKHPSKDNILYYGNIDTVLTFNAWGSSDNNPNDPATYTRVYGYPIITTGTYHYADITNGDKTLQGGYNLDWIFYDDYRLGISSDLNNVENGRRIQWNSLDPIRMKYKSTPHAVIVLPNKFKDTQLILPSINTIAPYDDEDGSIGNKKVFWDENISNYTYRSFEDTFNFGYYDFLWLGELYNPNVVNRFGGQTQEAFENNKWLPCGEAVSLYDNGTLKQYVEVKWTEGDTYYQRYDHIKTYPFTLEDQNSISEVVSFMCETRINLDGRYDRNRGNLTNFVISPENFNKINDVYNQENNFFVYRALNYDKFSLDKFPNSITWTKEKQLGELVDTWTNITMASTLDLDGEKGEITSLNTFNNEVFAFQKHGISHILFNSRVQVPTSDGVPIEITNGLKVDGKRYLSEIGTHNKWSISTTPNGIYFIDNITNGIYLFTGESLEPLSEKLGFSQWVGENGSMDKWNNEYKNFRTFYDKVNGDVYFTTKNTSLCFSETLGQFTSFMNYENLPAMFNIDNKFYSIKNNKIWEQNAGDYNMFYGEYKPYYVTYRVNPQPYSDKIFTNIDFRADTFDGDILTHTTFNKLKVWNEYQQGESNLEFIKGTTSNLKRKFRMWRANIPRDINNKRDRIRNPWTYIQLLKDKKDTLRTEFHDLIVYYFE